MQLPQTNSGDDTNTGNDVDHLLEHVTLLSDPSSAHERDSLIDIDPKGFHLRPPHKPHHNTSSQTHENDLFQTIHMGAAVVDRSRWKLLIDGLVQRPFSLHWTQLLSLPKVSITAFHECYGSPLKPPVSNLWRIGNVTWSGVALDTLLRLARPMVDQGARYVWSDGLEHGSFAEAKGVDRYQKDMPLSKALDGGVLVAYEMNGELLGKERGGPVRLIVPGWYGTNSTKWLCRLSVQETRSKSPFTTVYYNEIDPKDPLGQRKRPCWEVEPNSFLLSVPADEGEIEGPDVTVSGRAWSALGIREVSISVLEDSEWVEKATVVLESRCAYEWQVFETIIRLQPGRYKLMARATDIAGASQPISGRRNHVHQIEVAIT